MKKYGKNIVVGVLIAILFTCFFVVLYFSFQSKVARQDNFEYVTPWNEGWILETGDGTETSITLPSSKINAESYTIKSILPRNMEMGDSLFVWVDNQDVKIYVDKRLLYSHQDTYEKGINKNLAPSEFIIISLNSAYSGKDLKISYRNNESSRSVIDEIYLGDKASVIFSLLRRNILTLASGVIILIFGLLSIFRFISNHDYTSSQFLSYLYKGIAMIILAFWFFFQSRARQFIVSNVFFARDMNFLMQLFLPIPLVFAIAYTEEKLYIKAARIFTAIDILNDLIYFALIFSGAAIFRQLNPMVDVPMYGAIFFCGITVILIMVKHKALYQKIKFTIYLMLVVAIGGIIEICIFYGLGVQGTALPIGIVIFTVLSEIQNSFDVMKTVKREIEFSSYKKSQKSLLASVSHEIRTPINSVLGLDEMIIRETNEAKIKDYAIDIRTSGQLLLSLVNDILEFSRMESGILRIIPTNYSLTSLLQEVCTVIKTKALAKNLAFYVKVNPKTPDRLSGDSARIKQVLLNLLNNAVKYTKTGSVTLTVDFDSEEENSVRLLFHVIDTGIGIKEEDINKVFMPFVRVDEEKNQKIEGTGLGMSITENLLELMGSRISLESKYGRGSDFSCRIVQKMTEQKRIGSFDVADVSVEQEVVEEEVYIPSARLLVVDDTPLNIKVFRGLMKESGAEIDEASDGYEAVEKCKDTKYDIIFMDQKMPGMDGPSTMHEIKDNPECRKNHETPVILLTANAVSGIYDEAIKEGFKDYLSKPIDQILLTKALKKHLPIEKIEATKKKENPATSTEEIKPIEPVKKPSQDNSNELLDLLRSECGLDIESALKNMGNKELYISVLKEFAESGRQNAEDIEAFKNSKDIENYTIKVHALKSSARIIGAKILSSEAKDLEELGDNAKTGNTESLARIEMSTEKMLSDYRSLAESIQDVLKLFDEGLNDESSEPKKKSPEISKTALNEAYSIILEMTDTFDLEGIKSVLDSISQYEIPKEEQDKVKALLRDVSQVNYQGIKELLS